MQLCFSGGFTKNLPPFFTNEGAIIAFSNHTTTRDYLCAQKPGIQHQGERIKYRRLPGTITADQHRKLRMKMKPRVVVFAKML
jgi:hypothetical protein